jgi:hypothetical protein
MSSLGSLAHERSYNFEEAVKDAFKFRVGQGVTALLTLSSRADYSYIFDVIKNDPTTKNEYHKHVDEINENKWFILVYDLHNNLN